MSIDADSNLIESVSKLYKETWKRCLLSVHMITNFPEHIHSPEDVILCEGILNAVDNAPYIHTWQSRLDMIVDEQMTQNEIMDAVDCIDFEETIQRVQRVLRIIRTYQSRMASIRMDIERLKVSTYKWAFDLGANTWNSNAPLDEETWQRLLNVIGKPYFRGTRPDHLTGIEQYVSHVNALCHTYQHHEQSQFNVDFKKTSGPIRHVEVVGQIDPSRDFIVQEVQSVQVANAWGLPQGWHMSHFVEVGFPFVDTTRSLKDVLQESESIDLTFRLLIEHGDVVPEVLWKSSVNSLWIPLRAERTVTSVDKGKVLVEFKTQTQALSAFGFGGEGSSGDAFGDPYINPMWGRVYKMPVDENCYRFLDVGFGSDRLIINVKFWIVPSELQEKTTEWGYATQGGRRSRSFFDKSKEINVSDFANSVGSQSFVRQVSIILGDKCVLLYDVETHSKQHSIIELSDRFLSYGTSGALPVYRRDPALRVVASLHTNLTGRVGVMLDKFVNPQLRTNVSVVTDRHLPGTAYGLMCRHYIPETVRVDDLFDTSNLRPVPTNSNDSVNEVFIENGTVFNVNIAV